MIEQSGQYITKLKRKMKYKIKTYRRIIEDLHKQIELCQLYKEQINDALQKLYSEYKSGLIDQVNYLIQINKLLQNRSSEEWYSTYDNHINICNKKIKEYHNKIYQLTLEKQTNLDSKAKLFMLIGIITLMSSLVLFFQPAITGLIPYAGVSEVVSEDGYEKEGFRWMEIYGSRSYERCLLVKSEEDFNSVKIIAKVTSALDAKDLSFSLYSNNIENNNEPSSLVSSCKVTDYNNLWKSCLIKNIDQNTGNYWICASNPRGDQDTTYYTIGYQVGDQKTTALWTGENWQKLDRSSYTIKAQFMQDE